MGFHGSPYHFRTDSGGMTMENVQYGEQIQFLRVFFSAMRQWQLDCKSRKHERNEGRKTHESFVQESLTELKIIFDKYCLLKEFPENIVCYDQPSYDPDKLTIIEIVPKRAGVQIVIDRTTIVPRI